MHHVQLSGSGNYVIDNYTSFTIPRNIEIVPTSGKGKTISLLTATNPLEAYNMPEITVGTLKAADGKTDFIADEAAFACLYIHSVCVALQRGNLCAHDDDFLGLFIESEDVLYYPVALGKLSGLVAFPVRTSGRRQDRLILPPDKAGEF